jgi:biopolymer transport protein ExbB
VNIDNSALGFGHFIAQADIVGKTLLVILIAMSIASWAIIAVKGLSLLVRKARAARFLQLFWNASSLDAVAGEVAAHGAHDPFSHLSAHAMHAHAHHARYGTAKLEETGSASDFVTRTIKKVLDEENTRLENGLSVLYGGRHRHSSACARSGACITRSWPSACRAPARSTRWPARWARR